MHHSPWRLVLKVSARTNTARHFSSCSPVRFRPMRARPTQALRSCVGLELGRSTLPNAEVTFMAGGKNYPIEDWYPNTTISISNLGRKLMWTIRLRGNPVDKTLIEMTPDRRSFTFTSQYVEQVEPINCVRIYERQ